MLYALLNALLAKQKVMNFLVVHGSKDLSILLCIYFSSLLCWFRFSRAHSKSGRSIVIIHTCTYIVDLPCFYSMLHGRTYMYMHVQRQIQMYICKYDLPDRLQYWRQ